MPNAFQLYKDETPNKYQSYIVVCQEIICMPLSFSIHFWFLDIYIFSPRKSFSTKAIKKNVLLLCLNRAFINSRQGINVRYIYTKLQFSSLKLLVVSNKVCGSYLSRWSAIPDAKAYELDINKYKIRLIYYIILSHGILTP